jgi:uncharacterized protein
VHHAGLMAENAIGLISPRMWPSKTDVDAPLVIGAALFGVGWGLVGLCPGPALENLATLSPRVIAFVAAMSLGIVFYSHWDRLRFGLQQGRDAIPVGADG